MSKLPRLSGEEVIKILTKHFGFKISRQEGSHVTLIKFEEGRKITTVVPLHREIKPGTLNGILKLAEIKRDDFLRLFK